MRVDARLPEGAIILCAGDGGEHSFLVRRLGLSVECPTCGQVALGVDLVADFFRRSIDFTDVAGDETAGHGEAIERGAQTRA
jgi:hypothetical protein